MLYQSTPPELENPFDLSALYSTGWTGSTSTSIVSTTTASSTNYTNNYTVSSTTPFGRCFRTLPESLRNVMTFKFPFSYFCDAQVLILEMINGNGSAQGDLDINLNNLATTTLIDKQAIAAIRAVVEIKKIAGYSLYISPALLIMRAVLRVF